MTVQELINKLSKLDKNKEVILSVTVFDEEDVEYYDFRLDGVRESIVNVELSN